MASRVLDLAVVVALAALAAGSAPAEINATWPGANITVDGELCRLRGATSPQKPPKPGHQQASAVECRVVSLERHEAD